MRCKILFSLFLFALTHAYSLDFRNEGSVFNVLNYTELLAFVDRDDDFLATNKANGGKLSTQAGTIPLNLLLPIVDEGAMLNFYFEKNLVREFSYEEALGMKLVLDNSKIRLIEANNEIFDANINTIEIVGTINKLDFPLVIAYTQEIPYLISIVNLFSRLTQMEITWSLFAASDLRSLGQLGAKENNASLIETGGLYLSEIEKNNADIINVNLWSNSYMTLIKRDKINVDRDPWDEWFANLQSGSIIWLINNSFTVFALGGQDFRTNNWEDTEELKTALDHLKAVQPWVGSFRPTATIRDAIFLNLDGIYADSVTLSAINQRIALPPYNVGFMPRLNANDDARLSPLKMRRAIVEVLPNINDEQRAFVDRLMLFLNSPSVQKNFPSAQGVYPLETENIDPFFIPYFENAITVDNVLIDQAVDYQLGLYMSGIISYEELLPELRKLTAADEDRANASTTTPNATE